MQQWGSAAAGEVAVPDKSSEVDVMMKGSYKVDL